MQDFPRVRRRCTIPPSSTCWIGFDLLQHGVDLAGLDLLGGGVGWIRVGLATNDQYIGINTWRRRICLRTPTSNSSTLCFSPAWLVGGCTMHIIVHLSNDAQSIRSTAPALVSMNLASKEVAKSFPSDHKKWLNILSAPIYDLIFIFFGRRAQYIISFFPFLTGVPNI